MDKVPRGKRRRNKYGALDKWLKSPPFQGGIHGFEFHTHYMTDTKDKEEGCTCGEDWLNDHTCPYKVEINDDNETLCTCCDHCRSVCAEEV